LRDTIRIFADILHKYTNPDASEEGFGWTNAAQAIFNGDAAMYFHGDWVKGYLVQLGWKPGADFGVVGAPGASEVFLYGVDVFSLPRGAQNEPGAREFLTTVASREGQLRFNQLKGSSPIRKDIEKQDLDAVSRDTLEDLERAKVRMLVPSLPNWDDALGAFAKDGDEESLFRALTAALPH
jgi:glucose/mannose transport system substrate-binding protein